MKLNAWVADLTPVKVASFESEYKCLSCSDICCDWNVVYIAKSEKIHIVNICGLWIYRISEKQENVNFVAREQSKYLFCTATATEVAFYGQTCCFTHLLSGSIGSHESMLGEYAAVSAAKLNHKLFLGVMSNDRDLHYSVLSPLGGCI